jgi:GTP-binding protein YchF
VVRCFEQQDVAHVDGSLDPGRDVETIRTELALADLETIQKRKEKVAQQARSGDKTARTASEVLEQAEAALDERQTVRGLELMDAGRELLGELFLLTAKPVIFAANVSESDLGGDNPHVARLRELAAAENAEVVEVCAELESQLADLSPEDAKEYMEASGLTDAGTDALIRSAYRILGLITFFTGTEKEVRARAIPRGSTAVEAAADVHTDIARGFIGAEVIGAEALFKEESLQHAREDGRLRLEGRDYEVQDGDVIFFRFNV